jgi:starch synthase
LASPQPPRRLKIAYAVAEAAPWCATGGLGDVSGALPQALSDLGADVALFLPLYREVRRKIHATGSSLQDTGAVSSVWLGGHRVDGRFLRIVPPAQEVVLEEQALGDDGLPVHGEERTAARVPVYVFDCAVLFDRDGLYGHGDDCARFSTFSRAVLNCASRLMNGAPDVIHCHDWHTALIPLFLSGPYQRLLPHTASVLTVHNLGYQGIFPASELPIAGFGPEYFTLDRLEFYGRINFLKGGLTTADALSTVSPRYADEIRTPEFGERLDPVLRQHGARLYGILNGIDGKVWNPETDPHLPHNYSAQDLEGKGLCRRAMLAMARMNGDDPHPVFGVVSRFARQKGLDLVAELVPYLVQRGGRLLLLGQGEPGLEQAFQGLEDAYPQHVRVAFAHDPRLAHLLQAGADATLMPSRYEPCGLTQLYAMRYGTLPIVRAVGGLRDTVVPTTRATLADGTATGFTFEHDTLDGLKWAVDQALQTFYREPQTWKQVQQQAMAQDFSWKRSAERYLKVFELAVARRRS